MRSTVLSFVFLTFLSISVSATDYRPDTEFPDLGFSSPDVVYDVYVHTDGKFVVAGEDFGGSTSVPFLKRYFANGTLDTSFISAIQPTFSSSQNYVTSIRKVLPNGQYVVSGIFYVASTFSYWARLNSDGSFDSTIPTTTLNAHLRGVQDDGKLLFCGPRTENGITYNTLFRRNADLSFDPTFRITFADTGTCPAAYPLPSGQILLNGDLTSGGQQVKELQRINSDGTLDLTFDPAVTATSNVKLLSLLPDGKILIGNSSTVRLLNADGSQVRETPYCSSTIGIGLADGSFMVNGCKKWASGTRTFDFLRIKPDGSVEQSMDWIRIAGFEGLKGFREDGNGGFYLFGGISLVNNFSRRGFVRLVPDTSVKKARFDFDGDGRSDLAVFRPSDGVWYLNQSTEGFKYRQWGFSTDRVAAADADMDQKADIGVFRDGAWHALTYNDEHKYMCLGAAGDKPLVGFSHDFLQRDFLVSRRAQGGLVQWFIRSNYTHCWSNDQQPTPNLLAGELETDIPVVADLNGDSLDDIGYFRDGTWYVADPNGVTAPMTVQWGIAGDIPVPGDYDGDRQADFAIFRPSTGEWWINRSSAGPVVIAFGLNGDIPVPADYDGDGKIDIAIYRNGQWWRHLSQTGTITVDTWGVAGDIPIPAQAQF